MSAICSAAISRHGREVLLARADVEADQAGVGVLRGERVDRVRHPALLADLLEEARRGRAAEDRVEQRGGEAALGRSARSRARRGRRGTARCPCAGSAARAAAARRAASALCGLASRSRRQLADASPRDQLERGGRGRGCPAAARTTLPGHVHRRGGSPRASRALTVEITSAVPITGRPSGLSPKTASRDQVVDELRAACPRPSRSPRARPRARSRGRRSAARRPCRPSRRAPSRRGRRARARRRPCARATSPRSARRRGRRRSPRSRCAVYERVPLNSRCSMKCVTPAWAGVSSREPAPIQKPSATERTWSSFSVIRRSPESSSVRTYFCTAADRSGAFLRRREHLQRRASAVTVPARPQASRPRMRSGVPAPCRRAGATRCGSSPAAADLGRPIVDRAPGGQADGDDATARGTSAPRGQCAPSDPHERRSRTAAAG